jgi:hypothetical protein
MRRRRRTTTRRRRRSGGYRRSSFAAIDRPEGKIFASGSKKNQNERYYSF